MYNKQRLVQSIDDDDDDESGSQHSGQCRDLMITSMQQMQTLTTYTMKQNDSCNRPTTLFTIIGRTHK